MKTQTPRPVLTLLQAFVETALSSQGLEQMTITRHGIPVPGAPLGKRNKTSSLLYSRLSQLLIKLRGYKDHHSHFTPPEGTVKHYLTIGYWD